MPIKKGRQYRNIDTDLKLNNFIVEGYCLKFKPYFLGYDDRGQEIFEQIERSAFANCDMSDVIMQYDHTGKVVARQSNRTLKLSLDDIGLRIRADLSKSKAARNLYEEIENKLITKMSWGFAPASYFFDNQTRTIHHRKVKKIYDVSAVSLPANDDTEIQTRSFCEGAIAEMNQEMQKRAKERLLLKIKISENTRSNKYEC